MLREKGRASRNILKEKEKPEKGLRDTRGSRTKSQRGMKPALGGLTGPVGGPQMSSDDSREESGGLGTHSAPLWQEDV